MRGEGLQIGRVPLKGRLVLASMEEHTTLPFRLIAKEMGANLVITEMGQADRIAKGDRMALRMLASSPQERPVAGQVLGADHDATVEAAKVIAERGFDLVDVNLSCPIRRVIARGWGGAYLADVDRTRRLLEAVVRAVSVPVTLKFRSGWDADSINAPLVARIAEEVGVRGVILHGRSVVQAYAGPADWDVIRATKQAVGIPVFGAGSIRTPADAVRMLQDTGCDGVSIARGCLGNPWIFSRTRAVLAGNPLPPPPGREERLRVLLRHLDGEARFLGARGATPRLVRLALYYAKELSDFSEIKASVHAARSYDDLVRRLRDTFRGL
ncbi:MAG TPA: tRNA-dihydrouridine synthase [Planctomycetota bacterium]|jgi:tRNA-dihydrouridine synthase B|nr:tRNA-dihydrouridine synthase [Planctomycetota bacterium]